MNAAQVTDVIRSVSNELPGQELNWLKNIRSDALHILSEQGFPHKKHEDWKYTNVQPILEQEYTLQTDVYTSVMPKDVLQSFLVESVSCQIVFINGRFSNELSQLKHDESWFEINSLAQVIADKPDSIQPYLVKITATGLSGFNALNTASIIDGLYLHINENVQLKDPIHVLYLTAESENLMVLPRNLILLDENAKATIIEQYASINHGVVIGSEILVNVVGETRLASGASLEHIKLHQENSTTTHIASHTIEQHKASHFNSKVIATGGKLIRSDTRTRLVKEHAECELYGLYIAGKEQHMDFHTMIEHVSPSCSSRQDYRGVLDDRARGVFNGRIYVHQDAQHTDADQSNKTLLLSKRAEMDTKPQLEIYADDVKCSHGATVGQLDKDMLFYLRSRGLTEEMARNFLVKGFVSEILKTIQHSSIRNKIEQLVDKRLGIDVEEKVILQ